MILILISNVKAFGVSYTDIDYTIFNDAAKLLSRGRSPFDRPTYRYTPLISYLMLPNLLIWSQFGKLLFASCDVISGFIMYKVIKKHTTKKTAIQSTNITWLYNPFVMIISTRGSCESVMTALILLFILLILKKNYISAGFVYGISVHFKIYPIIYSLVIYLYLSKSDSLWKSLWLNQKKLEFFISSLISFVLLTYSSYYKFGDIYINEAWLYHFQRRDTQHNFSPFFFFCYLITNEQLKNLVSLLVFIPQFVLIVYFSFYYGITNKNRFENLVFCMFCQTVVFVTLNKVITSQYFIWYLTFLPLIIHNIKSPLSWTKITIFWFAAQIQWLIPAYFYEIAEIQQFIHLVGIASIMFVYINLQLLINLIDNFNCKTKSKKS